MIAVMTRGTESVGRADDLEATRPAPMRTLLQQLRRALNVAEPANLVDSRSESSHLRDLQTGRMPGL
jgi:hypothetical protein